MRGFYRVRWERHYEVNGRNVEIKQEGRRKEMYARHTQSPCGKEVALQELKKGMQTEFVFVLQILNPCKMARLQ